MDEHNRDPGPVSPGDRAVTVSALDSPVVGYRDVLASIVADCHTEIGRQLAAERGLFDDADSASAWRKTLYALARKQVVAPPPAAEIDPRPALTVLGVQGLLETEQWAAIHRFAHDLLASHMFFHGTAADHDLARLALGVPAGDGKEVIRAMADVFDPSYEVLDSASVELRRLSAERADALRQARASAERLIHKEPWRSLRAEDVPVFRNGLFLLVLSRLSSEAKGVVHGTSRSGATFYFEPSSLRMHNARLVEAEAGYLKERARILRQLTARLAPLAAPLLQSVPPLARLDAMLAELRWLSASPLRAYEIASVEEVSVENYLHPRLASMGGGVTPNRLQLARGCPLVISGPNAGGKTVTLTGFVWLAIFIRKGWPIPGQTERLPWPTAIHVVAGDAQNLAAGLSSFAGHLSLLQRALELHDGGTWLFVDELGAGTNDAEGGALALGLLSAIRRRGGFVAISTHLQALVEASLAGDWLRGASLGFDSSTLQPTYGLRYDIPGQSHAMDLARRLHLDAAWISAAEQYERENLTDTAAAQQRLHRLIADQQASARILQREREELVQHRQRIESEHVRQAAERQAELLRLRDQVGVLRRSRTGTMTERTAPAAEANRVEALIDRQLQSEPATIWQPGARARIRGGVTGIVVEMVDPATALIEMDNGTRWPVDVRELSAPLATAGSGPARHGGHGSAKMAIREIELPLGGLRVHEMIEKLTAVVDRALADGDVGQIRLAGISHERAAQIVAETARQLRIELRLRPREETRGPVLELR